MSATIYQIVEVKSASEDGAFGGILSTYGNVDQVGDICDYGCYDATIREKGVKRPLLWQHDPHEPIGSFEIVSAEDALRIEGRFNLETVKGREGYALLKAGDINGLSIGYAVRDYSWDRDGNRHLKDIDLMEGSLVTFPANTLARAQAKSIGDLMSKYAKMKSLDDLTEEQRNRILAELEAIEEGTEEDDAKSDAKADDAEDSEDDPTEDAKSEDNAEEEEEDDEVKGIIVGMTSDVDNFVKELKSI